MNKSLVFFSALVPILLAQPSDVKAVTGGLTATVSKVMVNATAYGGCMALLSKTISSASPAVNCPGNWISFSCTGTYASKDLAFFMLDQAQLALSLNKNVTVYVDDTKKHNGYCFANRIEVIK